MIKKFQEKKKENQEIADIWFSGSRIGTQGKEILREIKKVGRNPRMEEGKKSE